jgi:hypothetical protein
MASTRYEPLSLGPKASMLTIAPPRQLKELLTGLLTPRLEPGIILGLLLTSDNLFTKVCTYAGRKQHGSTKTKRYASSGIRSHDPSNQAAKTYALDRATAGTAKNSYHLNKIFNL